MSRLCPLCGASNADAPRHRYSPAEWPLKECRSCSTLYLEEVPTYSQLAEELAWEKTFVQETKERSDRNPLLYRLGHIPKVGEAVEHDGRRFTVMEMEGRRISKVKVEPVAEESSNSIG